MSYFRFKCAGCGKSDAKECAVKPTLCEKCGKKKPKVVNVFFGAGKYRAAVIEVQAGRMHVKGIDDGIKRWVPVAVTAAVQI